MAKKKLVRSPRLYAKSQDQIAKRLGITQTRISQLVNGIGARPSWELSKRMAKEVGVEPAWVMDASVARLRTIVRKIANQMVKEEKAKTPAAK